MLVEGATRFAVLSYRSSVWSKHWSISFCAQKQVHTLIHRRRWITTANKVFGNSKSLTGDIIYLDNSNTDFHSQCSSYSIRQEMCLRYKVCSKYADIGALHVNNFSVCNWFANGNSIWNDNFIIKCLTQFILIDKITLLCEIILSVEETFLCRYVSVETYHIAIAFVRSMLILAFLISVLLKILFIYIYMSIYIYILYMSVSWSFILNKDALGYVLLIGTLQWRHYERDGVSNHQRIHCLPNHLFGHRSKKASKFRVTVLCEGNSLAKGQ